MGRILKRVPLDFDWKLGKIWHGYQNPYNSIRCDECDYSGYNPETKKIKDSWYGEDYDWINCIDNGNRRWNRLAWENNLTEEDIEALVRDGQLRDFFPHWYRFDDETNKWMFLDNSGKWEDREWKECEKPEFPTPDVVNEWNRNSGLGLSSTDQYVCVKAKAKRLEVYGLCEKCNGKGYVFESDEIEQNHDNWENFDPPTGDGFQLWETTSEGSPKSPVFKTLEELCEWCEPNAYTFANYKSTKEEWFKMLNENNVYHQEGNIIFL